MATLFELSAQMQEIEAILEDNGGELTPELEQAWNETKESLEAKIDSYTALARKFEARSKAVADEIKRLQSIKKTADNSVARLKEHLLTAMTTFGISRIEGDKSKAWVGSRSSIAVDEETVLSEVREAIDELQAKLPPYIVLGASISKTALNEQYKTTGELPEGCEMNANNYVTLK